MTDESAPTEQPEMGTATVTCHTEQCGNAGIALDVPVVLGDESPTVVCGVCGQQITDIK